MPRRRPSPRHSGDQPAKRRAIGDSASVSRGRSARNEGVSECEDSSMSNEIRHDPLKALLVAPSSRQSELPVGDPRPADVEMSRVLKTAPLQMASDSSNGAIAHWKHGPLHDVVEPMTDHVIMAYDGAIQRIERRRGGRLRLERSRSGVVTSFRKDQAPMGHSEAPSMSSSCIFRPQPSSALPRSRHRHTERSPGANGTSRPHHFPITDERGGRAAGQCSPGCPVQTATDGSRGYAYPG